MSFAEDVNDDRAHFFAISLLHFEVGNVKIRHICACLKERDKLRNGTIDAFVVLNVNRIESVLAVVETF